MSADLAARLRSYAESIALQADLNIEDWRTVHDLLTEAADAIDDPRLSAAENPKADAVRGRSPQQEE